MGTGVLTLQGKHKWELIHYLSLDNHVYLDSNCDADKDHEVGIHVFSEMTRSKEVNILTME